MGEKYTTIFTIEPKDENTASLREAIQIIGQDLALIGWRLMVKRQKEKEEGR